MSDGAGLETARRAPPPVFRADDSYHFSYRSDPHAATKMAKIITPIADVRIVEPPHEIKGFSYFMAWHPRLTAEPAHIWFREQLRRAARTI